MTAFAFTIFLGAFLVFQVQPVLARYILPWFGGTPAVWTTAVMFFQIMLLAGYGYAHLIATRLTLRRQVQVHAALLAVSLAFLPVTPDAGWKPVGAGDPVARIVLLLLATVGFPYMMAAATAPLVQSWFARANPGNPGYRLYALSNTGSVLGLLSYPLLVEPIFGLTAQTRLWSAVYALFVLACVAAGITAARRTGAAAAHSAAARPRTAVPASDRAVWLVLSATGVVVLLAATNQLCRDVMVVPLLWVLPLTLYLLSFIVAFGRPRLYHRPFWAAALVLSLASVIYLLHLDLSENDVSLILQIAIYSLLVLACCMVCHGELYRLRPAAAHLTSYYLTISVGGALGGAFVTLAAPLVFPGYWEFHIGLVATLLLFGYCAASDTRHTGHPARLLTLGAAWFATVLASVFFLTAHIKGQQALSIATSRSFYGILRVYEHENVAQEPLRSLYHGRISHGHQYLDPGLRHLPVSYYDPEGGAGVAIAAQRAHLRREAARGGLHIGVIGLGAATLAAYGEPGDRVRFYEINPDVTEIARRYFTYLSDTAAETQIVHGDARISLERELQAGPGQAFDVLIVDAFSGDAIPVHLLTREALTLYRAHLAAGGVIALHISNLHFDLRNVVRSLADEAGMKSVWIETTGEGGRQDPSDWILLTAGESVLADLRSKAAPWPDFRKFNHVWTDDFANVLATALGH